MMHAIMHAIGWACLLTIFVTAAWAMFEVVAPQWRRILSLAAGNIEPTFAPNTAADTHPTERLV